MTLACSIYGAENLIYLILDEPDLARRFSRDWQQVAQETLLACEEAVAGTRTARAAYAADSA